MVVLSLARLLIIILLSFYKTDFNLLINGLSILHFFVILFVFYTRRYLLLVYIKKPRTIINSVYFVFENYNVKKHEK